MIKTTATTLKFTNKGKLDSLNSFILEYERVVGCFIDKLWNIREDLPLFIPKEFYVKSWLSARAMQCAGKQAIGIIRGTVVSQQRRKYMVDKFNSEGSFKKARKLQKIIDNKAVTKPSVNHLCPELDSRFIDVDLNNPTSFDGWLTLSSLGEKLKILIPFKRNKHFNKLFNNGMLKKGIRISRSKITFMFDLQDIKKKQSGEVVGIDVGQLTTITCSNGYKSCKDIHGWSLKEITDKLCRKQKGSKAFQKAISHRTNYINWTINKLNLNNVKELKLERIKNMRSGKNVGRRLSHWTYTEIFSKLSSKCLEQGVLVTKISPTYTSKRCSKCGWTRKCNRKGKLFKCSVCGYTADADENAASNIALPLKPINYKKRHQHDIKTGFYWLVDGQEPIVPAV